MRLKFRGFSMLQVVVAFALLAGFSTIFLRQFNQMSGAQRGLASKNDAIGAEILIRTILQNGDACRQTFTGMAMDGDWHPIVVKDPSGTTVLEPGAINAAVKVTGIRAKGTGSGATRFVTLETTVQRPLGTNTIEQKISSYANVLLDASGAVLTCAYGSTDVWNLVHQETFGLPFEARTPPIGRWWLVQSGSTMPAAFPFDFYETVTYNNDCYTNPAACTAHRFPEYLINPRGNIVVLTGRTALMSNWNGLTAHATINVNGGSVVNNTIEVGSSQGSAVTTTSMPYFFDTVPGTPLRLRAQLEASTWGANPASHQFVYMFAVQVSAQHYLKAAP